jgi:hypothetical protein
MSGVLIELGSWGRKYKGDFIAGAIAFLVPFLITWAIKGFYDIVTLTSLVGLIVILTPLVLSQQRISAFLLRRWRKAKFQVPVKIGILNGYLKSNSVGKAPNRPSTDYDPKDWYDALSSNKEFDVDWTSATQISDRFAIILNPFGEEYPEIDKPNLTTLRRIVRFVKEGGIFVNVAGLAFYYSWDGKSEDITGSLYETYQLDAIPGLLQRKVLLKTSHLLNSSLYSYFGVRTTFFQDAIVPVTSVSKRFFEDLDKVGGAADVKEFRSPYRCEKEEATLKPLLIAEYPIPDPTPLRFECYPIAAIKYGKGYLVLNGMKLEKARHQDFEKEIGAVKRMVKKLSSEGEL